MSRNLCQVTCHECPGGHDHILLEEDPRPVSLDDVGSYYWSTGNYAGLIVAKARCILCHTLYLAWVDWPSSPHGHWRLKGQQHDGRRFCDLSYRHAFNDEPSIEDTPLYAVEQVVTYVRRPVQVSEHTYRRNDYGDEAYRARKADEIARWEARRNAAVASKMSVADEMAASRRQA